MNRSVLLGVLLSVALAGSRAGADNWPSFRGPSASGVAEGSPPPVSWDVPANRNVKWRVQVAGLAHSSPIVWGNQVCVATAARARRWRMAEPVSLPLFLPGFGCGRSLWLLVESKARSRASLRA